MENDNVRWNRVANEWNTIQSDMINMDLKMVFGILFVIILSMATAFAIRLEEKGEVGFIKFCNILHRDFQVFWQREGLLVWTLLHLKAYCILSQMMY